MPPYAVLNREIVGPCHWDGTLESKLRVKSIVSVVVDRFKTIFEEQEHTQQKNTVAVLDGVRGLAILFVLTFHINLMTGEKVLNWQENPLVMSILMAGGTGVTLFFVLSGFLLFMPYAKALLFAGRWPLARTFYLRRALRIIPAYYFSLFVLILLTQRQYLSACCSWFFRRCGISIPIKSAAGRF